MVDYLNQIQILDEENKKLRKALEKIMEVEEPIMEGLETVTYKIAREALGGEAYE